MSEQKGEEQKPQKLTMGNTKKEMLAAYKGLVGQLEEQRETQMKPDQKIKEKEDKTAVEAADSLSTEGIGREIGDLKSETGKMLAQLSDRMEEAIGKYERVKTAVAIKDGELEEIYEVQRAASSLTALLEVHKQKREQFEADMAERKEELEDEIESTRQEWEEEKAAHEAEAKEREAAEKKHREREAEEFKYRTNREKQLAQEEFEYEKAKLDREIQLKQEEMERDLSAREKTLGEREAELRQLREKAAASPQELEAAVSKAIGETTARLNAQAATKEGLLEKDAEAEQKVLKSRIDTLQQTVKEQAEQIARLSAQIERSYGQVQDIAVKAIEGSANVKALAGLQQQVAEQTRRASKEDSRA